MQTENVSSGLSSGQIPMGSFAPVLEEDLCRGGNRGGQSSNSAAIFVETVTQKIYSQSSCQCEDLHVALHSGSRRGRVGGAKQIFFFIPRKEQMREPLPSPSCAAGTPGRACKHQAPGYKGLCCFGLR